MFMSFLCPSFIYLFIFNFNFQGKTALRSISQVAKIFAAKRLTTKILDLLTYASTKPLKIKGMWPLSIQGSCIAHAAGSYPSDSAHPSPPTCTSSLTAQVLLVPPRVCSQPCSPETFPLQCNTVHGVSRAQPLAKPSGCPCWPPTTHSLATYVAAKWNLPAPPIRKALFTTVSPTARKVLGK